MIEQLQESLCAYNMLAFYSLFSAIQVAPVPLQNTLKLHLSSSAKPGAFMHHARGILYLPFTIQRGEASFLICRQSRQTASRKAEGNFKSCKLQMHFLSDSVKKVVL